MRSVISPLKKLTTLGFPKQKVRKPVAMAYLLAYDNDMLMNLYSYGFQGPKYPVAKKM